MHLIGNTIVVGSFQITILIALLFIMDIMIGEMDPCELYNITEDELDEFIETFELYGGEYGFHTIHKIIEVKFDAKDRLI